MASGGHTVGWGREQDDEDEEEKLVYAEDLAKVWLVNRLIPSPPKSNH